MKNKQNEINSHIQIPRIILKNFKSKNGKLYHLDLSKNVIDDSLSPTKLGTIEGYYYPEVEKFLNEKVENKVGNIFKDIVDFAENKVSIISISDVNKVKKFVEYSIVRGNHYVEEAKEKLNVDNNIPNQFIHNLLVYTHMEKGILDKYKTTLLLNKTNAKFVTISNTIYFYEECVILPIAPMVCIVFSKKCENVIRRTKINDDLFFECKHYYTNDSDMIEKMNKSALEMELNTSNKFIVGSIEELKKLQKYSDDNSCQFF